MDNKITSGYLISAVKKFDGKDGKQYVVFAASGGTAIGGGLPISDALIAYRLPN